MNQPWIYFILLELYFVDKLWWVIFKDKDHLNVRVSTTTLKICMHRQCLLINIIFSYQKENRDISYCMQMSDHYIVYLKLIQYCMSTISQKKLNKWINRKQGQLVCNVHKQNCIPCSFVVNLALWLLSILLIPNLRGLSPSAHKLDRKVILYSRSL